VTWYVGLEKPKPNYIYFRYCNQKIRKLADLFKLQWRSYVREMTLDVSFQCSHINGLPYGARHALSLFCRDCDYQFKNMCLKLLFIYALYIQGYVRSHVSCFVFSAPWLYAAFLGNTTTRNPLCSIVLARKTFPRLIVCFIGLWRLCTNESAKLRSQIPDEEAVRSYLVVNNAESWGTFKVSNPSTRAYHSEAGPEYLIDRVLHATVLTLDSYDYQLPFLL
jgi:hypothetical protein